MSSTYHWFIETPLRALITAASALAYSPIYNPRRTEDTTYGIWTTALIAFVERTRPSFTKKQHLSLLIIPQYNLYVSLKSDKAADANPDDSNRTEPDVFGKKHGLFTDIAVLRQTVKMRKAPLDVTRSTTFLHYVQTLPYDLFCAPEDLWVTRDTRVSILVELKPPPTRTPKSIQAFFNNLDYILGNAERQAELQGHVLMCTKRFSNQDSVILIAGAGDWWRCRLWNRLNSQKEFEGQFGGDNHIERSEELEDDLNMFMSGDDDEIEDREEFMCSEDLALNRDQAIEQAKEERWNRLLKRNEIRERLMQSDDATAWEELNAAPYPFSISEINLYARLKPMPHQGDYIARDDVEVNDQSISSSSWSPILRLGTTASNKFLAQIEKMVQRE